MGIDTPENLNTWPGKRLGRPAEGPGSIAGFGRRLIAVTVDWVVASLLVLLVGVDYGSTDYSLVVLGVFGLQVWVLTALAGATVGQHLLGLGVIGLDGRPAGWWKSLIRTLLMLLVFPAFIWDVDQRGLHDKVAGTLITRTR